MPLPLSDPRWNELLGSYGDTEDIVAMLGDAYEHGGFSEGLLGDLINEIQHQDGTSTAMYAVAPHLIALARQTSREEAFDLLINAGLIYASSRYPKAVECPGFLKLEFEGSSNEGLESLARLVGLGRSFDSFKYAAAAMAGFLGHHEFARFLDGLDYFDGQFHHMLLDEPFPPEAE